MTFHDLSFKEIVCCPNTGGKLDQMEPWLFCAEDNLYPKLCRTPVLHPDVDAFLKSELWAVSRAFAEMNESSEVKDWFYSRYGFFNVPDNITLDSEVLGEGYPGFWDCMELPDFIHDLETQTPENIILDFIGDHHPALGLDLGCGQGGMLQLMAGICRQAVGVDNSFFLAATANNLLGKTEIPIRHFVPERGFVVNNLPKKAVNNAYAVCGDIQNLPFNEPLFDWVHCGHVLDLLDDPAEVIIQIKQIMKPGGTLSISTPWDFTNPGHFDSMIEILTSDFEDIQQMDGIPWLRFNHKRRFILHEDWVWVGKLKTHHT